MENTKEKGTDPENTKLQYLYNILQEQFQQKFNEIYQNSCRNRNNLLTLIEWISHDNLTVAANLVLQRNDVIAKHINGSLQIAPFKSNNPELKSIKFNSGIIDLFEIERINAELKILSQQRPTAIIKSNGQNGISGERSTKKAPNYQNKSEMESIK
ncbi:hypothetical protein LOAG_19178 [Loa loa]|uniref:Uncharacterized protein n=1 Tax=Loa loa TaxID=7209 RepID=A0A1S0UDF6_LOALO|nr:hypothetical protein LOAG_19178 [Loa loa]EJD73398.1 hypothetical protein LOAG_19178 [Loa loa]